jgi:hypothetical protein
VLVQPGVEVVRPLEVEQGNQEEEDLKRTEADGLDAGLLAGGQGAAKVLEQAKGDGRGFGLPAQSKELVISNGAAEVFDGDAPLLSNRSFRRLAKSQVFSLALANLSYSSS